MHTIKSSETFERTTTMQTSLISIISSTHGRLRREQRDISKRDLQAAIKYGSRSRVWGQRWKFEYDGIIFITDAAMCREITSYPAPLIMADIDGAARLKHEKAKEVIALKPDICTSHTVLVVDNSGSMKTHDIPLHRDRQVMAYSTIALENIAEQLFNETANNRDVVSLVEFDNKAKVVVEREPISWVLYNKLLSRRDLTGSYQTREHLRDRDCIHCDSNYLPALEKAHELLRKGNHSECALSMMFLSDGVPTDAASQGLVPSAAAQRICDFTANIASEFGDQLNLLMVGFGSSYHDFATLKSMVQAAQDAPGETEAEFQYCGNVANAVGTAVSSLVSSTMRTRTALHGRSRTFRNVPSEDEGSSNAFNFFRILNHYIYQPREQGFVPYSGLPFGALRDESPAVIERLSIKPPPFVAVNKFHCGTGAERLAFRSHLADNMSTSSFRLGAMVAKETREVERIEEHIDFHRMFCETQSLAAHLAGHFNRRLHSLPAFDEKTTPTISFLRCSILLLEDKEFPHGERGMLVEKRLDTDKFGWCKWNNNFGGVHGRASHAPFDEEYELKILKDPLADIILEEEDSDYEDSSDGDNADADADAVEFDSEDSGNCTTDPSAYLQAFSHFTYLFTNRKVLVCDLQGVLNTESTPPMFELSDPAIHSRSAKGRHKFGNTDKGQKGITSFFKTHKCSNICEHMKLSRKNKEWMKEWREFGDF